MNIRTKKLNLFFLGFFIFLGLLMNSTSVEASRTISDDLYVSYPKSNQTLAIDISQDNSSSNYLSLITYGAHGKGNQLLGYEYRPEKDGYIIYSGQDNQQVVGSTSSNTAKVTTYTEPINNFTTFDDSFVWDISATSDSFYTIKNRKSSNFLTLDTQQSDGLLKLTAASNGDNQKFKLRTMNGIYSINSFESTNLTWDIKDGVSENREVIAYPQGNNQSNQKWLILYKPNNNAYTISNFQKRNLIAMQPSATASPKVINNNVAYDTVYSTNSVFNFQFIGDTSANEPIVTISNGTYPSTRYIKDSVLNSVSALSLNPNTNTPTGKEKWILKKISDIPKPEMTNLKFTGAISENNSFFYVGEVIKMTGDIYGNGFSQFDLYSKFNIDQPVLSLENQALNSSGKASFSSSIDTTDFKEGSFFLEVFARADSMFQSNRIATKTELVYPTPSGEAVPQVITKGTPLSKLNSKNFVNNVKDEIGSTITIGAITNIDTNVTGTQTAKITLANKYKETVIEVPVTVGDSATLSWANDTIVDTKAENVDKSNLSEDLEETFYWKSISGTETYQVELKKGDEIISKKTVSGGNSSWTEDSLSIPIANLDYGDNQFTLEIFSSDNHSLDKISMTISMVGSLKIDSIPTSLDWTDRTLRNSKGILSRDEGNTMTLSVIDTRNVAEDQKTWFLSAQAMNEAEVPFSLVWKNNASDSVEPLSSQQQVFSKSSSTKSDNVYKETWDENSGVLLSSNNYIKAGNYSNKITVNWNLYDTYSPE